MDKESDIHPPTIDDADELEDAYRMAISFGSSSGGEGKMVRETIGRRLNLLVQKLDALENRGAESDAFNIDGAQSYLESLLRTLVKPPDSDAWSRLMANSRGKETPTILRRGRTLLVSFLVGIRAPRWKDCGAALQPSPVPSYLGYLSANEELRPSTTGGKEQNPMNRRSSHFLPRADVGETTIPPSPMVTEVGLSLCVKKFLHKDAPEGNDPTSGGSGAGLFRNYGPLPYYDNLADSVAAPLPDVNELTRDLFDLTLRLAADDESEHENKPFPLRLVTPSSSESLNIILQVASDHLEWLSPHSISSRYQFILQHIIQSFQCLGGDVIEKINIHEEGFVSWSRRASFLIGLTKTVNRGRMALYATQFMTLLCSGGRNDAPKSFPSTKQPHFYACLQLRHFWNDIDKTANDLSSNIMARVLDLNFCANFLLSLSFQSALLLASSFSPQQNNSTSAHSQGSQSVLSLVTILCSVLDLLGENGFLHDCIHVGWSIQMLLFSISYFVFGEDYNWREREFRTLSACDTSSDSMWEYLACQLNRLYCDIWGREWQFSNNQQSEASGTTEKCVCYESIGNDYTGVRMVVLMPSFKIFVAGLINFACNLLSTELNAVMSFCQFIAKMVMNRYAESLQSPPFPKNRCNDNNHSQQNNEFSIVSSWIGFLISNLEEMVCCQNACSKEQRQSKGEKVEQASIEKVLADLITPMLRNLHLQIIQRVLCPRDFRCQNKNDCSNCKTTAKGVASVFVDLYKQEVKEFLNKPSPSKTRRWSLYRTCLEKVFELTPPSIMFACPGHPALSENSSNMLKDIWNQYGQCELSHSISIMVAAGLHVNASATCLTPDVLLLQKDNGLSRHLKQLYETFSSNAKNCIINTFKCFNATETKQPQTESLTNFNDMIRFVRRELAFHREAEVGLTWWNEISDDLVSLLKKTNQQDEHKKSKVSNRDITRMFSTLQNNLSAISGSI